MVDNHIDIPYPKSITHIPYRYPHRYLIDVRSPISISHIDIGSYLVTLDSPADTEGCTRLKASSKCAGVTSGGGSAGSARAAAAAAPPASRAVSRFSSSAVAAATFSRIAITHASRTRLARSAPLNPLHKSLSPIAVMKRRKLNLKAKFESGLSHFSFKRLVQCAFNVGLIGSTCTALP